MTAVPPPVPPEIVEKATHALKAALWGPYGVQPPDSYAAAAVIAAVYGDIVEAARRDALAGMVRCDDRAPSLVPDVQSEFCVREPGHGGWHETEDGMHWINNEAPRTAPAATVGAQDAVPRTPGTNEAQKAVQGRDAEPFPAWVLQAMDDHQQQAEARMRRLFDEEPTDD